MLLESFRGEEAEVIGHGHEFAGNFPGRENNLLVYACAKPFAKKHKFLDQPGIDDSSYNLQIIPLMDPKDLEPMVSVEVKKAIFAPDGDGNGDKTIRDQRVVLEKCDLDSQEFVPSAR